MSHTGASEETLPSPVHVATWRDPLLLLETFVDPERYYGGVYRAANWIDLGLTQGIDESGKATATRPAHRSGCLSVPCAAMRVRN